MKFCGIKMTEGQGESAKAGLSAPDEPIFRRPFGHSDVTLLGRGGKGDRTSSKASTIANTTLFGLFIAGSPFLLRAEFMNLMSLGPQQKQPGSPFQSGPIRLAVRMAVFRLFSAFLKG